MMGQGTRIRSHWAAAAGVLGALAAVSTGAQDLAREQGPLPTLEIAPGKGSSFRAVVLPFRTVGAPVGDERIATLREEIERGLEFSSVVRPLDHDAYLGSGESPALEGESY